MNKILLLSLITAYTGIININVAQCQVSNYNSLENILTKLNNAASKDVLVAAHRGDWRNAPENSIQAIKNSIRMGVDIVEIDVRMTKDSALVLIHDMTLDRTTTGTGKVLEWTLDSLQTLFLRNGQLRATHHKIPSLKDAMLAAKGNIMVNLDKCSAYMDLAYRILKETGTAGQVIFKGSKDIEQVRKQYGSLLDEIIYMPIIKKSTPQLDGHVDDFFSEYKPVAFEVIYTSNDSPMFGVIETISEKGSRIWVNTLRESLCGKHDDDLAVEDPDGSWGWVIDHGANIIQTDRPALLLEYLRENGLHD